MSNALSIVWGLAWLAFGVFCIMDLNKYDESVIEAAGQKKQTLLIMTIVGTLCCGFVNLYYYFGIKPKLDQAQSAGGGGYTGYAQ